MKFTVRTQSGQWIGGFMCRRSNLAETLDELRDVASLWDEPLIARRLDRGIDEQHTVQPRRVPRFIDIFAEPEGEV